jgi:hypothetical protein
MSCVLTELTLGKLKIVTYVTPHIYNIKCNKLYPCIPQIDSKLFVLNEFTLGKFKIVTSVTPHVYNIICIKMYPCVP